MIALLIDIGNSRIKWRVAAIERDSLVPCWLGREQALDVEAASTIEPAFAEAASSDPVDGIFVSNVASRTVADEVLGAAARHWPDAVVHALHSLASQCGVDNGYREPERLGPDRWLALIGAHVLAPDRTVLVCNFGTATTIDLLARIDGRAVFTGGLILPGFGAMRRALAASTARLPVGGGRPRDFADNTDDAIASGIAAAQLGAIERSVDKARNAMRAECPPLTCLIAGGDAARVAALLGTLDVPVAVVHDLVLRGIAAAASDILNPATQESKASAAQR